MIKCWTQKCIALLNCMQYFNSNVIWFCITFCGLWLTFPSLLVAAAFLKSLSPSPLSSIFLSSRSFMNWIQLATEFRLDENSVPLLKIHEAKLPCSFVDQYSCLNLFNGYRDKLAFRLTKPITQACHQLLGKKKPFMHMLCASYSEVIRIAHIIEVCPYLLETNYCRTVYDIQILRTCRSRSFLRQGK